VQDVFLGGSSSVGGFLCYTGSPATGRAWVYVKKERFVRSGSASVRPFAFWFVFVNILFSDLVVATGSSM